MKIVILIIFLIINCTKNHNILRNISKDINDALILAIQQDNKIKAEELIKEGANVNHIYNNKSILEIAIDKRNLDILELLIENNILINKESVVKIYDLALNNFYNCTILDMMQDRGYKIEEGEVDNKKYFLLLCYTANLKEIKKFIENKDLDIINIKDINGRNSLHITLMNSNSFSQEQILEIIELFLVERININDKTNDGYTALMIALENENLEASKMLIEKEANIDDKDKESWTALMFASQEGYEGIVKLLLEKGANVNNKNDKEETPLMLASQEGYEGIVKLLLEKGANVNDKNEQGNTSLMLASFGGHVEVVRILIEAGANINKKNENGYTALTSALLKNVSSKIAKILIKKGINIYEKDKFGEISITHVGIMLKISKDKFQKGKLIKIAYLIIRKISEDYIELFIHSNKNANIPQNIKDNIHNKIKLLYSLQRLPLELFEEIIKCCG